MEKEKLIALVQQSQSGDQNAIEKLLQYAHTSISYQCRKMLTNKQDAEDMTQEVLVTIYTKLDTLQEPAAFWKWANQITTLRCINALKRTHVEYQFAEDEEGHSILDDLEELDEQVIPDKAIDNAETVRMIEEIVDGLPAAQRAATLMFYYNEMSVKEIAQTMQVSENTVKSRLNYARKAIKEKVLDYEKQGVKLYGLSPLPFLLYFLRLAARNSADKEAAGIVVGKVMAAGGAAAGIAAGAGSAAAGVAAGVGGAAAAAGGSVATATAATAATSIFTGITAKIVAGILAAAVTVGGVAAAVIPNAHGDTTEPATVPTEATSVMETESVPETELSTTETPTEELTEAPTEAPTEELTEAPTEAPTEETETGETEPVHQHDYEYKITTPPTCSYGGEATYTCACGHSYTEAVPKNEHVWSEWLVTREPTTTTYGMKVRTCELCHGAQEVSIDPLSAETDPDHEHNYTSSVQAPTCQETGYTTYTCSCGHTYTGDQTAATGHTFETETIPPTTDTQGYDLHTCTKCGLDYVDNFTDPLSSDETEPVSTESTTASTENAYTTTDSASDICTSCGIGSFSYVDLNTDPCAYRGYLAYQCSHCGYIAGYSYPYLDGHNMVDGVCSVCGLTQEQCEHFYDSGVPHYPAGSQDYDPYILYTCAYCGHTYTEPIE